ncbi:putative haloacid dehalogenase-like hydrolase [Rahnella aquatilis CIP 78.65 = ATCC 33071]|uniref:Haloacid dehalogenase superfamily protein, subfamily IA, variant 3 with third motif having DD or ED n=1 Tax=Rahnella aquatilis (strain ATCC 33071 / DSM 4594 / JCM 1683 / NBRC 105701 / NCIMB 13365 / CIP 78.65) TaxID=745277 RepID=H2IYB3_RAHAC|nr:glucose-1-phosphatase [Rahnella aquatilis]AEX54239.1 haloacid dehalogenase superfamily protein, subfamily IA, variant 3 with third motif having DD or ED [Rahnella aquatilis CIP 78.65 = ATCC 33071]KFD00476.1 putative haloacid dehalogenase-like hydrolase [Rahnella aquatilis CIP 78.65 = ATCC 33071]
MLYIFDMGNVIIDIDFKRVLGVWSHLSGTPLATLTERFSMGEVFQKHERGEISDEQFAADLCHEMGIALSFEQFSAGWHAVFVGLRPEVIALFQKLREEGHRVVVLSNTNRLHLDFWPHHYPEIEANTDAMYLSQNLGMRKPEPEIFLHVLEKEGFTADQAVFFDDVAENIEAARAAGIEAVWVEDNQTVPKYFS